MTSNEPELTSPKIEDKWDNLTKWLRRLFVGWLGLLSIAMICLIWIVASIQVQNRENLKLIKDCTIEEVSDCKTTQARASKATIEGLVFELEKNVMIFVAQCAESTTNDLDLETCVHKKVTAYRAELAKQEMLRGTVTTTKEKDNDN